MVLAMAMRVRSGVKKAAIDMRMRFCARCNNRGDDEVRGIVQDVLCEAIMQQFCVY